MEAKFSNRVKEVISLSREEALRLGHDYIGTEHLLLGMIREGEGVAVSILKKLGIPLDELRNAIERAVKGTANHNVKNMANIPLTRQSEKVLKITYLEGFKAPMEKHPFSNTFFPISNQYWSGSIQICGT